VKQSDAERKAHAKHASDGFLLHLAAQIDPDGSMDPDERFRRASWLRKAHMKRIALKSAVPAASKLTKKAAISAMNRIRAAHDPGTGAGSGSGASTTSKRARASMAAVWKRASNRLIVPA